MPLRLPARPQAFSDSPPSVAAEWNSLWQGFTGPEKRDYLAQIFQTERKDVVEALVCHTTAVREGFLFELPKGAFQNEGAACLWEQDRREAVVEFNEAPPEMKAERLENAAHLGQFAFLRHLVQHTGCVEDGFLCEWPRGAFEKAAEAKRIAGVEKALAHFRGLSDWEKVRRIWDARRWRQWGFLRELVRRTDCVSSGLLWDPPAAVVPASEDWLFQTTGRAAVQDDGLPKDGRLLLETEGTGSEGAAATGEGGVPIGTGGFWRKGIAAFLKGFRNAALPERMDRVQKLVALKQWRTLTEVLWRDSCGTRGGGERRPCLDWRQALPAPCPELLGDQSVCSVWMDAFSSSAMETAFREGRPLTGESRVSALQTWRSESQRWAAEESRVVEVGQPGGDTDDAARKRAHSSGFRMGMRFSGRLQPREIPHALRCDPEVVLGEWRESWTVGTGPLESLPSGTLERLAREGGGITEWREEVRTDVPEARAVWAWAWLRKAVFSNAPETPVVPAPLRHIPQVLRVVAGSVLEKLDTPINRGQRRFPDVSGVSGVLLNSGLWEEAGQRCAALICWVYVENFEIRQVPALLRNHPAVVALCGEGRVFLEPAVGEDLDALLQLLSREPVPWVLLPEPARARPEVCARFCSGWSRICDRALPRAAVPQQVWEGAASAQISARWARAWRTLVSQDCIPLQGIPAEVWNEDPRLRREMLLCWCRALRENVPRMPDPESAPLDALEKWYDRWSEDWMLHPRPPEFFGKTGGSPFRAVFGVGRERVELLHPDDAHRKDAVAWCGRLGQGDLPIQVLPERFYHLSEVVDAWVGGRIRYWKGKLEKEQLSASALLEEWATAPVFWLHAVHQKKYVPRQLVDLLMTVAGAGGQAPICHDQIPVWLRACPAWGPLARKHRVTLPDFVLSATPDIAGEPHVLRWLRANPVCPCVLEACQFPLSEPVREACRDGWLEAARKQALPIGAIPREFAEGDATEALAEGWLRFLGADHGLLSTVCLQQSFPRNAEKQPAAKVALLELEFQRRWLRWAENSGWLRGVSDSKLFSATERLLDEAQVRTVFGRWKRAWSFRLQEDLQLTQAGTFAGHTLPRVEARVLKWKEREAAFSAGDRDKQARLLRDSALADAIFSSWVWAVGASRAKVQEAPAFLENPEFRELHLEGWRRVVERRACPPEGMPAYVLEDVTTHAAWRRGWCARLAGEAVPIAALPEALRADPEVCAARLKGWERRLLEAPCSVWEISCDVRAEPRICDAWRAGWVRRFESEGESSALALLWPHLFKDGEVPGRSVLWLAPVNSTVGESANSGTGVPPGYEEAATAVQESCLRWKDWFLSVCEWDGVFRAEWEASPQRFVALCRLAHRVPPWAQVAAHLREDAQVCEAWVARHPLEKAAAYELQKISTETEGRISARRASNVLFDSPWAAVSLPDEVRRFPAVQKAVREGWEEKVRGDTAYKQLREFCERTGRG
jgi:hypothetical protein